MRAETGSIHSGKIPAVDKEVSLDRVRWRGGGRGRGAVAGLSLGAVAGLSLGVAYTLVISEATKQERRGLFRQQQQGQLDRQCKKPPGMSKAKGPLEPGHLGTKTEWAPVEQDALCQSQKLNLAGYRYGGATCG
jgi:hypothetical protein